MKDRLTIAALLMAGAWLFANVWQLGITGARLEAVVEALERRDARIITRLDQQAQRIGRLERR